jgi:hypothetical protein
MVVEIVAVGVDGVALGETIVFVAVDVIAAVLVIVPSVDVVEAVNEMVGVFDGAGLLVVVAVRLGVGEGMMVCSAVSVGRGRDVAAIT